MDFILPNDLLREAVTAPGLHGVWLWGGCGFWHPLLELEGLAFQLRWDGNADQAAWDDCLDPERMMGSVANTANLHAARLVGHAVTSYRRETRELLQGLDPVDYPDIAAWLRYLTMMTEGCGSIRKMAKATLFAREQVDPDAPAALARCVRRCLPVAPPDFSRWPYPDGLLVQRLEECGPRLQGKERGFVDGLRYKVSKGMVLDDRQRATAEALLRRRRRGA